MKILAAILSSWAILVWPGIAVVAGAGYFAPSALPTLLGIAVGITALAFWVNALAKRSSR